MMTKREILFEKFALQKQKKPDDPTSKFEYTEGFFDDGKSKMYLVPECHDIDETKFKEITDAGRPVVIRKCSFGPCTDKWTLDYLREKIGHKDVTIHRGKSSLFDFIRKNFIYEKCKFSEFAEELSTRDQDDEGLYLRSTNENSRSKLPARIEDDFPELADDLKPPSFIPYGKDNKRYHSSVLRVASEHSRIWMHFDLYDNVLCQVVGIKTVYLFPPTDSSRLYLVGDKSLVDNVDDWFENCIRCPRLFTATPYKVNLHPGDCLFIPSMWWHQIILDLMESKGNSIGFNIFWKDSVLDEKELYAPNDVYGNKNLKPYEAALANLNKAMQHLDKLPAKYGEVYKEMFYREVQRRIKGDDKRLQDSRCCTPSYQKDFEKMFYEATDRRFNKK